VQQDGSRPPMGVVVIDDEEMPESGWIAVDRADDAAPRPPADNAPPASEARAILDRVSVGRSLVSKDEVAPRTPCAIRGHVRLLRQARAAMAWPRFNSPGFHFVLLCLAAFLLSAGIVHSFARWKPGRVIVVPATITPGAVIT